MNEENAVVVGKGEVGIGGGLIEGRVPYRVVVADGGVTAVRAVARSQ